LEEIMSRSLCALLCLLYACTGAARPTEDSGTEPDTDEEIIEDVLYEPEHDTTEEDVVVETQEDAEEDREEEDGYVPECTEDTDCEDGDPCTVDYCEDFECWATDLDEDGDGYISSECGGTDCDDTDPTVWVQECEGVTPCCDGCTDLGCWYDEATGYLWEEPMGAGSFVDWESALAYCAGLSLAGRGPGSWHLPTISELRTLITGCPDTETGGACSVSDSCLVFSCMDVCSGCLPYGGPGDRGIYLSIPGDHYFWSSSTVSDMSDTAWQVPAYAGAVSYGYKTSSIQVRCISR
jgi:hypothetical protein